MPSTLFLQSEVIDPYSVYKSALDKNPVYWDDTNKIWAIYSYQFSVEVLKNSDAEIPLINPDNEQNLNEYSLEILNNLTRLSNGIPHEISKEIAMLLFSNAATVDPIPIIQELFDNHLSNKKIDWVNSTGKKLPILMLLKSFGFGEKDCDFISTAIEPFSKIMLPKKTDEQIQLLNKVSEEIFMVVKKHLFSLSFFKPLLIKISDHYTLSTEKIISISVSNFIGLCIQSFDAGRGILSNSLLQLIQNKSSSDKKIEKLVVETLRFDPPIHNTRRIAVKDFYIGESLIKKDDAILIVLASANRDSAKFKNAMDFDMERINNNENLTFGIGGHMCLAKYFSINLTTEALYYLLHQYKTIKLLDAKIEYEPLINARVPKSIWISITH